MLIEFATLTNTPKTRYARTQKVLRPGARYARGAAIPRGDGARPPVRLRLRLRREVDPLSGTYGAPDSP